ncbi:hypothetical protein PP182_00005 [Maribacter sp. PR1]|uniref:Uncharacterized protein n=1 Tax=Maribacter cobaltidurans TaxID=1178778 RepID=A0ABU7IN91_9FLAO|nr:MULTISPECIES: hypothetical protein [Maribacter]MDC6387046.1 hypothetical protein [Maribacter sp. PR1]MEE1974432.1 hypothetical protein [Maribacter cobaltidurans]
MDEWIEKLLSDFNKTGFISEKGSASFDYREEYFLYKKAVIYLEGEGIIESHKNSMYKITNKGIDLIENSNWTEYKSNKDENERFEKEKSRIDLKLAKETLKELPKTKWFARVGFFIAVVLALKELGIWLWQLWFQ